MATLRITMENTTRRALTASCLRTPPSSLMASPRDDTFSSTVRLFLFILQLAHTLFLSWMLFSLTHNYDVCLFLFPSAHRPPGAIPLWDVQEAGGVSGVPSTLPLWEHRWAFSSPSSRFTSSPPFTDDRLLCQTCVLTPGKRLRRRRRKMKLLTRLRTKPPDECAHVQAV